MTTCCQFLIAETTGIAADVLGEHERARHQDGPHSYVRDWVAEGSTSASGEAGWPVNSLEHALELELSIQEADMRLVRGLLIERGHLLCSSFQSQLLHAAVKHVYFDQGFLFADCVV